MSGRLTRSEFVQASMVWLLTIEWDGQVYRFSSYPVDVETEDGEWLHFDGGLPTLAYEEELGIVDLSPELQTVSLELVFPIDVAERIAAGHDLAAATGELARWREGDLWERRDVKVDGQVVEPEYGAADEPVRFSLEENPYDDTAVIPDPAAIVSESTWPSSSYTVPEASVGLYYPIVFGSPGIYTTEAGTADTEARGSPCVVVDVTGSNADLVVIAGHPVESTQVTLIDEDGAIEVFSVTAEQDGLGRTVSTVDVSGASSIDRSHELWVSWSHGASYPGVSGAGGWLRRMLLWSSLRVDIGRAEAVAPSLDRFAVGGYIDTPVTPAEWLRDNLEPLLPISMVRHASGIGPALWRYDASPSQARLELVAGENCVRASSVVYDRGRRDVINEIRAAYAIDGIDGSLRTLTHGPNAEPGAIEQTTSRHAKISASRYGVLSETIETDIVWDEFTIRLSLAWQIITKAFPVRLVQYDVGDEHAWASAGTLTLMADPDIHIDQLAHVYRRSLTDTGANLYTILLLEDPQR